MTEIELDSIIRKISKQAYNEPDHLVAIGIYKALEILYAERQRIMDRQRLVSNIS